MVSTTRWGQEKTNLQQMEVFVLTEGSHIDQNEEPQNQDTGLTQVTNITKIQEQYWDRRQKALPADHDPNQQDHYTQKRH